MLPECIYRDNLILTQFNKKSHQLNFKDRKIKKKINLKEATEH